MGKKCIAAMFVGVLALVLSVGLVACGGSSEGAFTGYAARDAAELDPIVDGALEKAKSMHGTGQAMHYASRTEPADAAIEAFYAGNAAYKEGDYATAKERYEAAIKETPAEYGSNVNLVLAELQLGENEAALAQALLCVCLYSTDEDILLNAQVAGAACHFAADDIEAAINKMLTEGRGTDFEVDNLGVSGRHAMDYRYNKLWSDIETKMHDAMQGGGGNDVAAAYGDLLEQVTVYGEGNDDSDAQALKAYLEAIGAQLGVGH